MAFLNYTLVILSGFAAGFTTAAAYVAFIAMLGIFPKVAAKTKTAKQCVLYENCLILGILLSTLLQFYINYQSANLIEIGNRMPLLSIILLIHIGLYGGIYIGFLIGGLSEILNVIPIYARITHCSRRIPLVIFSLALGKGIFTFLQFFYLEH